MNPTSRATRRFIAGAVTASAAVLIPTIALAASARSTSTSTTAASSAVAAPRCERAQLTAWLGIPGDGYAGGTGYQLEISNISHRTCTLYGYPGVSALGPGSHQLGSAAARNSLNTVRLVTLRPHRTAHVLLTITDVANYPASTCEPETAVALRVYAPNDFRSIKFPFSFSACSKRGPRYLHVTVAVGGTGVPGFSN
jgi:Protein of unknown function (DUF4232)